MQLSGTGEYDYVVRLGDRAALTVAALPTALALPPGWAWTRASEPDGLTRQHIGDSQSDLRENAG